MQTLPGAGWNSMIAGVWRTGWRMALLWVADGDFERAVKLAAVADRLHEEIDRRVRRSMRRRLIQHWPAATAFRPIIKLP